MKTLVVIPCGKSKAWGRQPKKLRLPVPARFAYHGAPFLVNRRYAETLAAQPGNAWVILSAKYGFLWPEEKIDRPYEVTFNNPETGPISCGELRQQAWDKGLIRFPRVVGLGGPEYRAALEAAFAGTECVLEFPFAGLSIGKAMKAALQEAAAVSGPPIKITGLVNV